MCTDPRLSDWIAGGSNKAVNMGEHDDISNIIRTHSKVVYIIADLCIVIIEMITLILQCILHK